jgi:AraC-like DNA-binding protein
MARHGSPAPRLSPEEIAVAHRISPHYWDFPDPAHFGHAFKAAYGMSPGRRVRPLWG